MVTHLIEGHAKLWTTIHVWSQPHVFYGLTLLALLLRTVIGRCGAGGVQRAVEVKGRRTEGARQQQGGQLLHAARVVLQLLVQVDFSKRVADDANLAAQLRHQRGDLLGVAQHLDALRVRVVAHHERPLDAAGELPATREITRLLIFAGLSTIRKCTYK